MPGHHRGARLAYEGRGGAAYVSAGIYLAVIDIEAARQELIGRGVTVSDIRHKSPIDAWKGGWQPSADLQRRDYACFADFADPDGNTWVLQEIGYRIHDDHRRTR